MLYFCVLFFFFKQKTAYEMRISDWSSDVCSSDLIPLTFRRHALLTDDAIMRTPMTADDYRASRPIVDPLRLFDCSPVGDGAVCVIVAAAGAKIGRAHV